MDSPMDSGPATGLPRCLPQSAVAPGILSPPQGWGTSYGVWSVLELPTTQVGGYTPSWKSQNPESTLTTVSDPPDPFLPHGDL